MFSRRSVATILAAAIIGGMLAACTTLDDFQRQVIFARAGRRGARLRNSTHRLRTCGSRLAINQRSCTLGGSRPGAVTRRRLQPLSAWRRLRHLFNLPRIMKLRDEGFAVLAIDYRRFGKE